MKIKIINSFEEFVDYTEKYKNNYFFRGQANKSWEITPSLFRQIELAQDESKGIVTEMLASGLDAISSAFKLQHYGTPTRICDLTISPLSALYFSTEDETQDIENGVVFVIDKRLAIPSGSYELNVFSRALITNELDQTKLTYENEIAEDIESILRKNYIIQYDYKFSYSNQRAMLQGGTALLFGFSFEDGLMKRIGDCKLDDIIVEKIIVPSKLKYEIRKRLFEIGFTKEILYHNFENKHSLNEFEITCDDFRFNPRANFNKINARYRVDTVHFDRDKLAIQINNIYQELFETYGNNTRIWTYFYFDENDLVDTNWICRTEWKEGNPCNISWSKSYYFNRLRYINEQISQDEIIERYTPLIAKANLFYSEITKIISSEDYFIHEIVKKIDEHKIKVKDCSNIADDIGKGNPIISHFIDAAYSFIKYIEHFIDEITLYINQGQKEVFIRYWCKKIIKDCKNSKNILSNESVKLGLKYDFV